jgi:hypothetical protein
MVLYVRRMHAVYEFRRFTGCHASVSTTAASMPAQLWHVLQTSPWACVESLPVHYVVPLQ